MKENNFEENRSHESRLTQEEWLAQYKEVPRITRDLWNVEMDLIEQFEEICSKYKLKWFADGGTLLGAVRHQGFIPWDDDIDIIMPWKDYQKLSSLSKEFKEPYFLQTWETEDGFDPFMMKIRRSDTTGYNWKEALCTKNWNKGISIDVFALVDIPDNRLVSTVQVYLLKAIRFLFRGYEVYRDNRQVANNAVLNSVLKMSYIVVSPLMDYRKLSKTYIHIATWQKTHSRKCGPLLFVPGKKEFIWLSKWYEKVEYLKFMNRMVPCPSEWDKRLRAQYHDYMTPVKGSSKHGDLTFDPYTPYWMTK